LDWYTVAQAQVKVFQCMQMKHPDAEGIQRVRCYPFTKHLFQGRNITDPVFFLPVKDYKDDFSLPEDKDLLEYGRVQLLFSVLIPARSGRVRETDLAFIKYLKPYTIRGEFHMQQCHPVMCAYQHANVCVAHSW
jgi:hypothetical protein